MTAPLVPTAAEIGTLQGVPDGQIPDDLASSEFDTAILVDPVKIQAYKTTIASQMNQQSGLPGEIHDLSERIADVTIETAAQGASMMTLSLIDPAWVLLTVADKNGNTFIQTDEDGYLWPPIDIHFPSDTDCWWRLVQVRYNNDLSSANGTLTFEDRIASILRERSPLTGGIQVGSPNQTLGGFIKQLVDDTNHHSPANIRLLTLIAPPAQDPNAIAPITSVPPKPGSQLHKQPDSQKGLTQEMINSINQIAKEQARYVGRYETMAELERSLLTAETTPQPRVPRIP